MQLATVIREASPDELDAVQGLLQSSGLPDLDPAVCDVILIGVTDGTVSGCAALERYGDDALLRSVAVADAMRGNGLGRLLTQSALDHAQRTGMRAVYLLTTTADGFFPRFGFLPVEREEVPAEVRASHEFSSACPASARVFFRPVNSTSTHPR